MPQIRPMLATLVDEPFDRPGWVYEEKYDGIRIVAERRRGAVRLSTRNLIERDFPEVAREVAALPGGDLVLDGELVTFDPRGVSRFQILDAAHSVYVAFDLLVKDGRSIMKRALRERRAALEEVVRPSRHLMLSRRLANGLDAYRTARREEWEGIVAKDESSLYEPGVRSRAWLKVKVVKQSEFVIGGYTAPSGKRTHFGAILIGLFDRKGLRYAGKVGSGFGAESLASLKKKMDALRVAGTPFRDAPRFRSATWLRPELVAQVRFSEWTEDGKLRHPVFLGLRDDKSASEVTWSSRER